MALADPLVLNQTVPSPGLVSGQTFVEIARQGNGTERLNEATSLSDPEKLVIKHQSTGSEKQGNLVDRHLLQLSRVERDTAGVAHTLVVNLTFSVPRNGLFTATEVSRLATMLSNMVLDSSTLGAILQNQS